MWQNQNAIWLDHIFLKVPCNQWQHLSPSSLRFQRRTWSTLSFWWVTAVNKHLLLLPDRSTLKSRNNHASAQAHRSDRQVKAPCHYGQIQFISGEVETIILCLSSYSNQGTRRHERLTPHWEFPGLHTIFSNHTSQISLYWKLQERKYLSTLTLSTHASAPLPGHLK